MKKIFGIGLSRTGTTSLGQALSELGFKIKHYPTKQELFCCNNDGACDIPAAIHFKELDKKFSNSKFIYTIREKNDWLDAMERYLKNKQNRKIAPWQKQNRIDMYGRVSFNRDVFSQIYDAHDRNIKEYFKSRKQDLLIVNICENEDIKHLFEFIGVSSDIKTYPHTNRIKV